MTGSVSLHDIVRWLDTHLKVAEIPDYPGAFNGLQVESDEPVRRVIAAVDASLATVAAAQRGDLFLTHHGLFWDGTAPVAGRRYRKVKALLHAGAALYSAHIPLDLHPEIGNNVLLARGLGVAVEGWFGRFQGVPIGVWGSLASDRSSLSAAVGALTGSAPKLIPGGPERVARVGIVSGAAGGMIAEAKAAGCDTYITGEGAHHTYFDAMEIGLNVLYAGHYATETFGVKALAERVGSQFGLAWEFHDHPTGL